MKAENVYPTLAKLSKDCALYSMQHSPCYNLITLNEDSGEALMAHVNPVQICYGDNLHSDQRECIESFSCSVGRKAALIIRGDRSKDCRPVRTFLKAIGIPLRDILHVRSGGIPWDTSFDPKTRELLVSASLCSHMPGCDGRLLYSGNPFELRPVVPISSSDTYFSEIDTELLGVNRALRIPPPGLNR